MLRWMITLLVSVLVLPLVMSAERPNIIVVLVDDMGVMDTSVPFLTDANGKLEHNPLNDVCRTPNMERLAAQGIRFSNFYAMSVCSPTRISILTGQTSARHHVTQWINPTGNNAGPSGPKDWLWSGPTSPDGLLPDVLHKAGYYAIHCGKAHFGPQKSLAEHPDKIGFDVNIAGGAMGQPGSYYGLDEFGHKNSRKNKKYSVWAVPGLEAYRGQDIFLTEALTLEINKQITNAVKAKKPFFAYMAHYAVHSPFMADKRFIDNYTSLNKQMAAFATLIEGMDKSLGDMLDHVNKLGVAEDTLVFFLGDNGSDAPNGPTHTVACAAPLRGKKGTHYEGGMRVPFIAAWAKPNPDNTFQKQLPIPAGGVINDMGAVYDLYPTIASVAGVPLPKRDFDGIDLSGALAGKQGTLGEREFLMHFPHSHRSSYYTVYRKGDWKVIYHYPVGNEKSDRYELFNLATDRAEQKNLAKSEPQKLKELMTAMAAALEGAGAQYPIDGNNVSLKPEIP